MNQQILKMIWLDQTHSCGDKQSINKILTLAAKSLMTKIYPPMRGGQASSPPLTYEGTDMEIKKINEVCKPPDTNPIFDVLTYVSSIILFLIILL